MDYKQSPKYVVVTQYDSKTQKCFAVLLSSSLKIVKIVGAVTKTQLVNAVITYRYTPLNFSINIKEHSIVMDSGDFSRFSPSHAMGIILAEIYVNNEFNCYLVLNNATFTLAKLTKTQIVGYTSKLGVNDCFIQNAVIRNNTVNAFPHKPFRKINLN